jgi:hypothetical protein
MRHFHAFVCLYPGMQLHLSHHNPRLQHTSRQSDANKIFFFQIRIFTRPLWLKPLHPSKKKSAVVENMTSCRAGGRVVALKNSPAARRAAFGRAIPRVRRHFLDHNKSTSGHDSCSESLQTKSSYVDWVLPRTGVAVCRRGASIRGSRGVVTPKSRLRVAGERGC